MMLYIPLEVEMLTALILLNAINFVQTLAHTADKPCESFYHIPRKVVVKTFA